MENHLLNHSILFITPLNLESNYINAKEAITVPVEIDGVTILVEATCLDQNNQGSLSDDEITSKVSGRLFSFDDVTETITAISKSMAKTLSVVQPTKATVEFGVELQYESGKLLAVIGKGSSKVNLKISLEWSK